MQSDKRDDGDGVPYQIQYRIRPNPSSETKLWVEDTGRWFAGPDGRPLRAHGVMRVINERYEHECRLNFLAHNDGLTGRTEPPPSHRGSRRYAGRCDPLSLILRIPAGGDRQSGAHQRVLRFRRHRSGSSPRSPSACTPGCAAKIRSAASPAASSAWFYAIARRTTWRPPPGGFWPRCAMTWCRPAPGQSQ